MITATCTIKKRESKKKLFIDIFIQRTSKKVFRMGSSSFWINFSKDTLTNPVLTFFKKIYSSGDYRAPKLLTPANNRMIGIQMFIKDFGFDGMVHNGNVVALSKQRLATISFDKISDTEIKWNTVDSGIATPGFLLAKTKWEISK